MLFGAKVVLINCHLRWRESFQMGNWLRFQCWNISFSIKCSNRGRDCVVWEHHWSWSFFLKLLRCLSLENLYPLCSFFFFLKRYVMVLLKISSLPVALEEKKPTRFPNTSVSRSHFSAFQSLSKVKGEAAWLETKKQTLSSLWTVCQGSNGLTGFTCAVLNFDANSSF